MAFAAASERVHPSFRDRREAGRLLAERVAGLRAESPVVLGLPRGGVPVAAEVARALRAPLDVIVVRKLGVPYQPELGFGAIGEGDVRLLDDDLVRQTGLSSREVEAVARREQDELARRVARYRHGRAPIPIRGRTVVIVDDGLATGGTAAVAVRVARELGARRVVVAVPVAPPETIVRLRAEADDVISLLTPARFVAVGQWYDDFDQTSDEEVARLLEGPGFAPRPPGRTGPEPGEPWRGETIVTVDGVALPASADLPPGARGVILFAHGSGSSRNSPRNREMARILRGHRFGTVLFDLLTVDEAADRARRFDVELLGRRLAEVTRWARSRPELSGLPIGYFGASTGAAAALWAAAEPGSQVAAVVSRGGRPDLAGSRLEAVRAPTLLIVGGADEPVLALNRVAASHLRCTNRLTVVPGATHLFEEPGALDQVAALAAGWFGEHLGGQGSGRAHASLEHRAQSA